MRQSGSQTVKQAINKSVMICQFSSFIWTIVNALCMFSKVYETWPINLQAVFIKLVRER